MGQIELRPILQSPPKQNKFGQSSPMGQIESRPILQSPPKQQIPDNRLPWGRSSQDQSCKALQNKTFRTIVSHGADRVKTNPAKPSKTKHFGQSSPMGQIQSRPILQSPPKQKIPDNRLPWGRSSQDQSCKAL